MTNLWPAIFFALIPVGAIAERPVPEPCACCGNCGSVTDEHTDFQLAFIRNDQTAIIRDFQLGESLTGTMPDGTPLFFEAIRRNLARVVRHMIASGANVLQRDKDGNTALQAAARARANDVIPMLVETEKFEINAPNSEGFPPLWYAVTDSPDAVEVLLGAGGDPNRPTHDHYRVTPLVRAAATGHAHSIPPLLAGGASVEGQSGFAAVSAASHFETEGHLEAIRLLGRARAPMHSETTNKDPLMRAIGGKKYKMLETLLESGADVNQAFENDLTQLMHAVSFSNDARALSILLKRRPDLNSFARFPVSRKTIRLVEETGLSEDDSPTFITMTALMQAASEGKVEMVEMLLEAGANPHLKNNIGQTARDFAEQRGHKKVVELLPKAAKASEVPSRTNSAKCSSDRTSLMYLARSSRVIKTALDECVERETPSQPCPKQRRECKKI